MKIAVGLLVVLVLGLGGFGGYQTYQLTETNRALDMLRAEQLVQSERSKADERGLQTQLAEAKAASDALQAQVVALTDKSSRVEQRAANVGRLAQARNELTRSAILLEMAGVELDQSIRTLTAAPDEGPFKKVEASFAKLKRAHGDLVKADAELTTALSASATTIGADAPEYTGARAELIRCREAQSNGARIISAFEQGTKRGEFTVVAEQGWQTSAVEVYPGDLVALKYAGTWIWGSSSTPWRQTPANRVDYRGEAGAPEFRVFSNAPNGAVILRVRGSEQATIASPTFAPDRKGPLEFRINDNQVADNSGAIDITIYVIRARH